MNDKQLTEQVFRYLDKVEVPVLEKEIRSGMLRADKEMKQATYKKWRPLWMTTSIVVCLCVFFFVSVRLSPAAANSMMKIPILSDFVTMIVGEAEQTNDAGLADLIEHEYYQVIGQSVEAYGNILTLHGAIADETELKLYYQFVSEEGVTGKHLANVSLFDSSRNVRYSSYSSSNSSLNDTLLEGEMTFYSDDHVFDGLVTYNLQAEISDWRFANETYMMEIPFQIEFPLVKTKRIEVGKQLEFAGQKLSLEWVELSPLKTAIHLRADEHNTMHILNVKEITIADPSGKHRSKITNGVTAFGSLRDGESTLMLQAHYFDSYNKLHITFDGVEMVPKDDDHIIVDFEQKKVLYQPDYIDSTITVSKNNSVGALAYSYIRKENEPIGERFQGAVDADGIEVPFKQATSHISDDFIESTIYYDVDHVVNPVKIFVHSLNEALQSPVEVEINIPLEE